MKIRRMKITLPRSHVQTAALDARAIAEAMAQRLHETGAAAQDVKLTARGETGATLAMRAALALKPGGGRHGR